MTDTEAPVDPSDRPTPTWLDASVPTLERVERLLAVMTLEEKAGLLFQSMITLGENGQLAGPDATFGLPSTEDVVLGRLITHFNVVGGAATARELAEWHNRLQELAASTRLGIPITLSSDPRHSYSDNPLASIHDGSFSQWPEPLGLAAIGQEATVEEFADIARQEYTAVGIRVALHPQIDLATEPRWARQLATFGEDVELTSKLGAAYIRGFQGPTLGPDSVATMTKHFPGGGPQLNGEDPHFPYGREQVYPGGQFELHLKPFEAAFDAGTSQIMPYYGMPVGTEYEEVGFGYNKSVITTLLRERYGFDGIVCTDWGLITDAEVMGAPFPARAWGVEHLSAEERMIKILDAGADQFGGESRTDLLIDLVRGGQITEARLDQSVRRLLREKFVLGLFDTPFVDTERAATLVGNDRFVAAGRAAQRASITILSNEAPVSATQQSPVLPLAKGLRIYAEGIDASIVSEYGIIAESPDDADVAIIRLQAPFETRDTGLENVFHAGSLDFDDDTLTHVHDLARRVPTVIDVFLDRPAILEPLVTVAAAVTANWGSDARALLDVLTGRAQAQGRLPFDVPRSMSAIEGNRPDVPFDTPDPLFRFGHGITL